MVDSPPTRGMPDVRALADALEPPPDMASLKVAMTRTPAHVKFTSLGMSVISQCCCWLLSLLLLVAVAVIVGRCCWCCWLLLLLLLVAAADTAGRCCCLMLMPLLLLLAAAAERHRLPQRCESTIALMALLGVIQQLKQAARMAGKIAFAVFIQCPDKHGSAQMRACGKLCTCSMIHELSL